MSLDSLLVRSLVALATGVVLALLGLLLDPITLLDRHTPPRHV